MAYKTGFLIAFVVALSVMGSEGGRTLANPQNEDGSAAAAVSHWEDVLPTTSIPDALKELISTLSSEDTARLLQIIDNQKAGATNPLCHNGNLNCNPDVASAPDAQRFRYHYSSTAADGQTETHPVAELLGTDSLCVKGNLNCNPAVASAPDAQRFRYHYGSTAADGQTETHPVAELVGTDSLCVKGNLNCNPTVASAPDARPFRYRYNSTAADAK